MATRSDVVKRAKFPSHLHFLFNLIKWGIWSSRINAFLQIGSSRLSVAVKTSSATPAASLSMCRGNRGILLDREVLALLHHFDIGLGDRGVVPSDVVAPFVAVHDSQVHAGCARGNGD